MKKLYKICCLGFTMILLNTALAQDVHFSQFFSAPLILNPAFTGKFDGNLRVISNYKNQWQNIEKAFATATVSADFQVLKNKISTLDSWGVGVLALTDKSANGTVSFNYAAISTSFHKAMDEDGRSHLSLGFQGTYANFIINTSKLEFEDQLTIRGFTNITSEVFTSDMINKKYADINAGFLYSANFLNDTYFYLGISGHHLNRPRIKFTGADYLLNTKINFQAGGIIPISPISVLHLSGLHSNQAKAGETIVGGIWERILDNDYSFFLGGWSRVNDAIIPYLGFTKNGFNLGITYDVNISSLRTASSLRGGIELSLGYNFTDGVKKVKCPKF